MSVDDVVDAEPMQGNEGVAGSGRTVWPMPRTPSNNVHGDEDGGCPVALEVGDAPGDQGPVSMSCSRSRVVRRNQPSVGGDPGSGLEQDESLRERTRRPGR